MRTSFFEKRRQGPSELDPAFGPCGIVRASEVKASPHFFWCLLSEQNHKHIADIMAARTTTTRSMFSATRTCYRPQLRQNNPVFRPRPLHAAASYQTLRHNTSDAFPNAKHLIVPTKPHRPAPHRDPNTPVYELTFTCKPCKERSSHTISKQGYHRGTTLIKCPACKNLHLISDHLHVRFPFNSFQGRTKLTRSEDIHRQVNDAGRPFA